MIITVDFPIQGFNGIRTRDLRDTGAMLCGIAVVDQSISKCGG